MKKMNWFCLVLALLMCLCMLPATAGAATIASPIVYTGEMDVDLPDNDELFAGYVERELNRAIYGDISMFGTLARDHLTERQRKAYDVLKPQIEQVARGERASTIFVLDKASDYLASTTITAEQLGVDAIFTVSGGYYTYTDEATQKIFEILKAELIVPVWQALIHDCPYDVYWRDSGYSYSFDVSYFDLTTIVLDSIELKIKVSVDYGSNYTVNTALASATSTAVANAKAIVEKHKAKDDWAKLEAYRDEIHALTDYNHPAADNDDTPYGDPWQLIYVFDKNPSTLVVCEGYSKAFKFLCDLSTFEGDVWCYCVSGLMDGGRHMWNIVTVDGVNYMADITNSDAGSIGQNGGLYMVDEPESGTWDTQYTFKPGNCTYKYNADVIDMWGEEVLKLGGASLHTHSWGEPAYEWSEDFEDCFATNSCIDCGEEVTIEAIVLGYFTDGNCVTPTLYTYRAVFSEEWAGVQEKTIELGVEPDVHTGETVVKNAVEATCGNAGYTGDTHCAACDAKLSDGEEIDPTGAHSYTVEVEGTKVPATCVDEGKVTKKCSGCEATKEETLPIDSTNHTGETVVKNAKEATCGEAGYTGDTHCAACDAKLSDGEEIDPTGAHSYTVEVEGSKVPATCVDEGKVTKKCSGCEATKEETLPIDSTNHTGETIVKNAKEADCGNAGYTGDTHCAACDAKLADGEEIPSTGNHSYTVEVEGSKVPATCVDEGKVTKKCANCGATKEEILPIDPANHTGETVVKNAKEADCGNAGYTGDTHCADCDAKLADGEVIPSTGNHAYTVEVEGTKVPATCIAEGKVTKKCSGCEATKEEVLPIDPANHTGDTIVKNAKEATCGEAGYTGDTHCAACDAKLSDGEEIDPTGAHSYTVEVEGTKVPATCIAEGKVTKKCSGCEATKEETLPIDPANHTGETVVKNAKEADCGNAGYTGDTHCADCDAKLADGEVIPSTGNHSYTVEVEGSKVPATCIAEGKVTKKCSGCEATKEETLPIDSTNHTGETVVKNAKEATCGKAGYTGDTHCAACDAKLADGEAIPATEAHQFTEEQEEGKVPATCKDTGSVIVKCANCDATTTKELEINPANHTGETVVKNAKEADCGNAGYTGDTHCADCDAKLADGEVIPSTGNHAYTVEVEGTKVPATCVDEGKVTKKCSGCEATKEETLPIDSTNHTGDTVVKNAKEATCGEAGYTGDTHCADCDAKLADGEVIPSTGNHAYTVEVEGTKVPATCVDEGKVTKKCSGCEATKEETLPIDPANHTGETVVKNAKEATCGEAGYTGDTHCADCDAKLADGEAIPATEAHQFTEEQEEGKVPATCKDTGSVVVKCANCNATTTKELEIDPANHTGETVVKNAKEADCGNAGYTGDTHCADCDAKLADGEVIRSTGNHAYTVEVEGTKVPATCVDEGKVTKKCSGCEATKEETLPIDPTNHTGDTVVKNAKEATCGEAGYTGDTHCADCDAKLADGEPIPATEAHQFTEEQEEGKVPATCKEAGSVVVKCANCDATTTKELEIDPENHTGETVIKGRVEPSCAQPGYTGDTHCADCDAKLADGETIPATGEHNFATETERKDPSCTEDGYVIMACGCGETQTTVLESTGHNAGEAKRENEVPATCQAAGSYDEVVRCTKCNEILSSEAKAIEKLAHIPGEMVIENKVEATTEAEGSYDEVTRCTKCNEIISSEHKIIPKLEEEVQQYTVTVTNGTGSGVYAEGAQVAIAAQVPANMKFIGWAGAEGLTFTTGSNATVNAVFTMPGRNVSLTAVLEEDLPEASSTVAFNANGGAGSMPTLTVSTGSTLALPTCGFTAPAGKQFAGWAYAADGEVITSPIVVTEDITLYAIWEDAIVEGDKPVIISTSGPVANVSEGETATLSVTATGADRYQWYINRGAGWEILPGATGSSYTTGAANDATSGYQYYCEVSNAFGSVNSHVFQLQMDDAGTPPQTGDNAQLGLWMLMMLLSAAGMIMLLAKMDRKAW